MIKRIVSLMAAALALLSASGQVEFIGGENDVIKVVPNKSATGLDMIFVVYDTDLVDMSYTATTDEPVVWKYYDSQISPVNPVVIDDISHSGMVTTLSDVKANTGYIIEEGYDSYCCWVVNYADYCLSFDSFSFDNEESCSLVSFSFDGQAPGIDYYTNTVSWKREELDREIKLTYSTLVWNGRDGWKEEDVVKTFSSLDQSFQIDELPLCDTKFRLSGDRFLKEWELEEKYKETNIYTTQAVSCVTVTYEADTVVVLDGTTALSAPLHIVFKGYPTDKVTYSEWQMSKNRDFEEYDVFNQDEVDYIFEEAGVYYLRYMVRNDFSSCDECYSDAYTIIVSESSLLCPNVFALGVTEKWKVSYKSLSDFHCWIFNRWGTLVCEYTDPSDGWDGRYNGRMVDAGVYYYVVTATGIDGMKYKKRGAITILGYRRGTGITPNNNVPR